MDVTAWGYAMAVVVMIVTTIDYILAKEMINEIGGETVLVRAVVMLPICTVLMVLNWGFERGAIGWVLVYCIIEILNIVLCNKAMIKLDVVLANAISNSTLIVSTIFAVLLGTESLSKYQVLAVIVYTVGVYIIVDIRNVRNITAKGGQVIGCTYMVISVLARSTKFIILQKLLGGGLVTNETLVGLGFLSLIGYSLYTYRDREKLRRVYTERRLIKLTILQVLCITTALVFKGRAIMQIGVVGVGIIGSTGAILQLYILKYVMKQEVTRTKIRGCTLGVVALLVFLISG